MKLISDIINELVDNDKSITSPLLKTKVLATRLNNKELLDWVDKEINGYNDNDVLPEYRKATGQLTAIYVNGNTRYIDQPIPTFGFSEEIVQKIHSMDFYQSVATLESYKTDSKSGQLTQVFPAELAYFLESNIRKNGNPFFHIISAKVSVSINMVTQVLVVIRSKLLDFMLKIDVQFGSITEIEDLKKKNETITQIMNQTIINTGDGNILNTGDNAQIKATIKIKKGDKEELRKKLKENNVSETDTEELIKVIDTEEPDREKGTFGGNVNTWVQKMIGKALDGSWQISIGAAGTLLGELIKSYYGL